MKSMPLIFIFALAFSGCATTARTPESTYVPTESEGLIFGQNIVIVDGSSSADGATSSDWMMTHVSRYNGEASLVTSGWQPGEFAFRTELDGGGHFVAALPVGTYYFVYFIFPSMVSDTAGHDQMAAYQTYMGTLGGEVYKPFVYVFEVRPNTATYVGNITHRIETRHYYDEHKTRVRYYVSTDDHFDENKRILAESYPNIRSIEKGIVEGIKVYLDLH